MQNFAIFIRYEEARLLKSPNFGYRISALRQERSFVLQGSTEKDFERNQLDFNHPSLSPFHPPKIEERFSGDPKLAVSLLGGQPLNRRWTFLWQTSFSRIHFISLIQSFSRDSLCSPKEDSLLAGYENSQVQVAVFSKRNIYGNGNLYKDLLFVCLQPSVNKNS